MNTPKIVYGVEAPLRPNENLYAVDEQTGKIELCNFMITDVARHSFVNHGDPTDEPVSRNTTARSILSRLGRPSHWVLMWHHHADGEYRVRSHVMANRVRRNGYEVMQRGDLGIACAPIEDTDELLCPPGVTWGETGWFVAVGAIPALDVWMEPPLVGTSRMLTRSYKLHPSKEFIAGVAALKLCILYPARDARDGVAWILLEPEGPTDFTQIGGVAATFRDEQAIEIWNWSE